MYVCVAENAELLVFFNFFLHIPHRQFTLPHPSPNCHQSQKLEFCSYFCPKKCPSFARTFTKISLSEGLGTLPFHTFLNPSIRQLLFDVEDGSFAASHKSSRRLLEFSHQFSGEIPAVPAAVSAGTSGISKIT